MNPPITNLFVGDILIPTRPYRYCLKVRKIHSKPDFYDGFATQRIMADRYDLSVDRQPVMENRNTKFSFEIYQIGQDIFRAPHDDCMRIKYYKKWKPETGQLELF